jgi:hypothetical protein
LWKFLNLLVADDSSAVRCCGFEHRNLSGYRDLPGDGASFKRD